MNTKSIKINFIMNAMLTMSSLIFPLITFPYISRILLPVGTGKVTFATSVISYFSMFAQLGIPVYGIRACAKVRDDRRELSKVAQELIIINIVTSAISYFALVVLIICIPKFQEEKTLLFIVSLTIFLTTIGIEWLYKALEKYIYITIRSIVFKFIALIAMFLLIHEQSDYLVYGAITIFASSASNVLNIINARKYIDLRPIGKYDFKKHIKPIIVFFAMSCAVSIYTNLDTVMLGFMKSDVDVGYYSASIKIKSVLVSLITSLGAVLLPRSSYYVERNMMEDFKKVTRKALSFVIVLSTPVMIFFILYAQEGILFLSGEAYKASILPMQILMPTLVLIGISNIIGIQILVPLGKEKVVLFSEIVGAIFNVIINVFLIPRFASIGAAIGTLIAEFVVLCVQYCAQYKRLNNIFRQVHFFRILIVALVSGAVSLIVKFMMISIFLKLLFGSTIFFVMYIFLLFCMKDSTILELRENILNTIRKK